MAKLDKTKTGIQENITVTGPYKEASQLISNPSEMAITFGKISGQGGNTNYVDSDGFKKPDKASYDLYREIALSPTATLALSIIKSPILDNSCTYVCDDSVPKEVRKKVTKEVENAFEPLLTDLVRNCLESVELGFQPFEVIWDTEEGKFIPVSFKPLLQESTQFLVNSKGQIRGLENVDSDKRKVRLYDFKGWWYTFNEKVSNPYGCPRTENVRVDYCNRREVSAKFAKYLKKISGIITQLHYPDGTSTDASGASYPNDLLAQRLLEAVARGESVRFPNGYASVENQELAYKLAGKSQWVLSLLETDGANLADGFVNSLSYYDKLIFRGMCRPEREGMESQGGTKSDVQEHSATGLQDSAIICNDIYKRINVGPVNMFLELNYGTKYKNKIKIVPAPLNKDMSGRKFDMLKNMLANPLFGPGLAEKIDIDSTLEDIKVPIAKYGPLKIIQPEAGYTDPRVANGKSNKGEGVKKGKKTKKVSESK